VFLLLSITVFLTSCGSKKDVATTDIPSMSVDIEQEEKMYLDKMLSNDIKEIKSSNNIRKVERRNTNAVYKAMPDTDYESELVATVYVRRDGTVMHAEIDENLTAVQIDDVQKAKIVKALQGYRYSKNEKAPLLQSGKITFKTRPGN
jgi:hypothetical protein